MSSRAASSPDLWSHGSQRQGAYGETGNPRYGAHFKRKMITDRERNDEPTL